MPPERDRLAELVWGARRIAMVGLSPRPERPSHGVTVRPSLVWMQVGVRHDETAHHLEAAGIPVVMDRCLAVDHQFLGG